MKSYKNNFQKAIELIAAREKGVFQVMLSDGFSQKCIGRFNEASGTFTTFRSEAKHLHKKSNCLAVNEQLLSELPGLRWVSIIYEDAAGRKRELKTSREYLLSHGRKAAYQQTGFEQQVFLPLSEWSMERAIRYSQELNSQPSLFGVA